MNILVITPDYPNRIATKYPFVKQLVDEFVKQGNKCSVVSPFSITRNKCLYKPTEKDGLLTIYRPNYFSFSRFRLGKTVVSDYFRMRAIRRVYSKLPVKPDVVYCHFWKCGIEGYNLVKEDKIPLFVATGESSILTMYSPKDSDKQFWDYVSGVICVSKKNMDESVSLGLSSLDRCAVFPNSVNADLFKRIDKTECRKSLNFPNDIFIVAFVGAFINRKGCKRLSDAIKTISGPKVYSVFIGSGDEDPDCDNILFKGRLPHEDIPKYLNAADVFVLPTLLEGCCNAIVEAMSCGLPIISSNLPFNWDILNDTNSILVDPDNIEEISSAIIELRDNKMKTMIMSEMALQDAQRLTIDKRARAILDFIHKRI